MAFDKKGLEVLCKESFDKYQLFLEASNNDDRKIIFTEFVNIISEYMRYKISKLANNKSDTDEILQDVLWTLYAYAPVCKEEERFLGYLNAIIKRKIYNDFRFYVKRIEIDDTVLDQLRSPTLSPEEIVIGKDYFDYILESFNEKEKEVLLRVYQGKSIREIAEELGRNEKDISNIKYVISHKLKFNPDLTRICPRCGIIKPMMEFGYRETRNGEIHLQSFCKECRKGNKNSHD